MSSNLLLNPSVNFLKIDRLPNGISEQLNGSREGYAISIDNSRGSTKLVETRVGEFLKEFMVDKSVVECVHEFSKKQGIDPHNFLEKIFPLIVEFKRKGILLETSDAYRSSLKLSSGVGEKVHGYEIVEVIRCLDDTEVFRVIDEHGDFLLLKRVPPDSPERAFDCIRVETRILEKLYEAKSDIFPVLVDHGCVNGSEYIVTNWINGRRLIDLYNDDELKCEQRIAIVKSLLKAYLSLQKSGFLHVDVNPTNILVSNEFRVHLVDFGGAHRIKDKKGFRVGVVSFCEPEFAAASLDGTKLPAPTTSGEQYNIATLCYMLLTKNFPIRLSMVTTTALLQIANERPRSFELLGLSWPIVENILCRALSKSPRNRHSTLFDFEQDLTTALDQSTASHSTSRCQKRSGKSQHKLDSEPDIPALTVQRFIGHIGSVHDLDIARLKLDQDPFLYNGLGGAAYALLRISTLYQDTRLLSLADILISQAIYRSKIDANLPSSFQKESKLTQTSSLLLSHPGLRLIRALVNYSLANYRNLMNDVAMYVESIVSCYKLYDRSLDGNRPEIPGTLDLMKGPPGLIAGSCILLEMNDALDPTQRSLLLDHTDKLFQLVERYLISVLDTNDRCDLSYDKIFTGFAHGFSGAIFVLLKYIKIANRSDPANVEQILDRVIKLSGDRELLSVKMVRGALNDNEYSHDEASTRIGGEKSELVLPGWCHGTAGQLMMWQMAVNQFPTRGYERNMYAAADFVWENHSTIDPFLCCGLAGEALALMKFGTFLENEMWIGRARILAIQAMTTVKETEFTNSLFRGYTGVSVLAAETMQPNLCCWPMLDFPCDSSIG